MDLDALLHHYFGPGGIERADPATIETGIERLRTDFAVERDTGRRFALWALLHALGRAPEPDAAFDDPEVARTARDYAWAASNAADKLE